MVSGPALTSLTASTLPDWTKVRPVVGEEGFDVGEADIRPSYALSRAATVGDRRRTSAKLTPNSQFCGRRSVMRVI